MRKLFDILKEADAIHDGHFVLDNGKHLETFLSKDSLYPCAELTAEAGEMMAEKVKNLDIDVVVGTAWGAVILCQWVAYYLSKIKGKAIYGVFTEKMSDKSQVFARGYEKYVKGKNVLVVEDWTSTGLSALKTVNAVRENGGKVLGVSILINRNPDEVTDEFFGAPIIPLEIYKAKRYDEKDCPMCKKGIPINTEYGIGKEYLLSRRKK